MLEIPRALAMASAILFLANAMTTNFTPLTMESVNDWRARIEASDKLFYATVFALLAKWAMGVRSTRRIYTCVTWAGIATSAMALTAAIATLIGLAQTGG